MNASMKDIFGQVCDELHVEFVVWFRERDSERLGKGIYNVRRMTNTTYQYQNVSRNSEEVSRNFVTKYTDY